MASRTAARVRIIAGALRRRVQSRRTKPTHPRRVLIAHHLLLGDTLMLTGLLAKLRRNAPDAQVTMAMAKACVPLYASRPYGVEAVGWDMRDSRSLDALYARGPFDLAIVPGDNRYSWLAQACGAQWIVAHEGDRPAYKNWPIDEMIAMPNTPTHQSEIWMQLVEGEKPDAYRREHWPAPECAPFDTPRTPYVVLHVGASSPLKLWPADRWYALAERLRSAGYTVVWSAGRGEESIIDMVDPQRTFESFAGRLSIQQLWHLLQGAAALVAPDTGVAHLGRVVGTPTVTLFGPGSVELAGPGAFWGGMPYRAIGITPFACRDQQRVFKRDVHWVRRCTRSLSECARPRCMEAIEGGRVLAALSELVPQVVV